MNTIEQSIMHIEQSLLNAENHTSKLNEEILNMQGMTGKMTRHFYNNLLNLDNVNYLEIGCWTGSSTCLAMYKNNINITIIDNFSGFGSPKDEFFSNLEKYKGSNKVRFIEKDCFDIDLDDFDTKFNIYLFDGDHSEDSQCKAINYYLPVLLNEFIFICDDWNWDSVRNGTMKAIGLNKLEILYKKEILLTNNNQHTHLAFDNGYEIAYDTWWNGIAIFILKNSIV